MLIIYFTEQQFWKLDSINSNKNNNYICYAYYYLINFRFEQFPDSNILWKEVASFTDALESEVMDQHGKFLTGI